MCWPAPARGICRLPGDRLDPRESPSEHFRAVCASEAIGPAIAERPRTADEKVIALGRGHEVDLVAAGQGPLLTATPRRYEIDFVAAAERGNPLIGRTWPLDEGWAYRLSRDDGTELFRAKVTQL